MSGPVIVNNRDSGSGPLVAGIVIVVIVLIALWWFLFAGGSNNGGSKATNAPVVPEVTLPALPQGS
jgi:hypothetical protein